MFFQSAFSVFMLFLVKMGAVYYILYYIIPRARADKKWESILKASAVILLATITCRLLVHQVIWPHIYHAAGISFSQPRLAARFFNTLLDVLQVTGAATAIKLFRLRNEALKKEKALVQEKLRSEILHLKAQINPHFLFNSLNGIYALSRSGSTMAAEAVMRLSKILRYVLYDTAAGLSSMESEVSILEDYIALQQLRFGERIKIVINKQPDMKGKIAPLLLLPLVENAFKHGTSSGGEIAIDIKQERGMLFFSIKNPAGSQSMKDATPGIGLSNIRRQLELQYNDFSFEHEEKDGKFVVYLSVNLNSYAAGELLDHRG